MATRLTEAVLEGSAVQEQISLETNSIRDGALRYRKLVRQAVERGDGPNLKAVERLMLRWFVPLRRAISLDQASVRRKEYDPGAHIWGPPILMLDSKRLAHITMHEVLSRCIQEPTGVLVVKLAYGIGRAAVAEECLRIMRKSHREQLDELDRRCKEYSPRTVNWWARKTLQDPFWNRSVCSHLGTRLLWHLVGSADCSRQDSEPFRLAFHHRRRRIKGKTPAFIVPDDQLLDVIEEGHRVRQSLRPRYAPMIVQPFAWGKDPKTGEIVEGGFARIRTPLVSKVTPSQRKGLDSAELSPLYDCLNAVNVTPWRINVPMLAVVEALWKRGGGEVGIPRQDPVPIPPRAPEGSDDKAVRRAKNHRCQVYEENIHLKAEREIFIQKLLVATSMADKRAIYFPHQLDFRSRFYPIPEPLNHQGDDVCRSILEFAEARDPGDRGTWWLKVHAANCFGIDKAPFESRVAWVEAHAPEIERAWTDPLNTEWWRQADKPLQFLAACHALIDPKAAAHTPVQLDGTCNGLQQYAALGRDERGAASVNLAPSNSPADVYAEVASEVARTVAQHAAGGGGDIRYTADGQAVVRARRTIARRLDGQVSRKLVKPTVMTSVYGVTTAGVRRQAREQLVELGIIPAADRIALLETKLYLAEQTLGALASVCVQAREIMEWIKACARMVTNGGNALAWTTPVGFPVVQPYRKWRTVRIHTMLGTLTLKVDEEGVPVHGRDQVRGAAPNFIHSIDASHAWRTALACRRRGVNSAFVHDSFWTHAADVDFLNRTLREEFVRIHQEPLLVKFHVELQRLCSEPLPPPPDPGNFNLDDVLRSPYFFS